MTPACRASLAAVLLVLATVFACMPSPAIRPEAPRTVLLLACRSFDGSDRVARVLDDMARATDVFGDTRFVVDSPPDGRSESLPALLARHPEASVAIAIVGDLSLLDGVDPSQPPHASGRLTDRVLRKDALLELLDHLEQTARAQDTALILASAPLGRQARVEVPELLAVAELVSKRGAHIDMAGPFIALEPALLFGNGLDLLDEYGHDAFARVLFEQCLVDDGPIPARNAAERSARLQARALAAFHADRQAEFAELAALALGDGASGPATAAAPASPRHAARLAAIASARDGLVAATPRWNAIAGSADDVPGLALGRALVRTLPQGDGAAVRDTTESVTSPGETFEAELVAAIDALRQTVSPARELATRCVEEHPERLPAWLVLQLVSLALPPIQDVRGEARRHIGLCPQDAVPEALLTRVFRQWPNPVDDLPALLLAERPWEDMSPTGPVLEMARRRAALGYVDHALEVLRDGLKGLRVPPSWELERQRIDALPRP